MIKKGIGILLTFTLLYFVLQNVHSYLLVKGEINLTFSLQKLYLFSAGFSALICINILLLSTVNKFKEQLGFAYLIALFLKIILFYATFYKSISKVDEMQMIAKLSILFTLLIFLLTEIFFVAKLINKKS
jgi:hypothetical protein